MKIFTKILIVILALTSLVPLMVGISCLFNQANVLELFGIATLTPDLEKVFPVLGSFMLASVVMPILSIIWLIKRKKEGYTLAYLVGFIALIRGVLIFLNDASNTKVMLTPIVMGSVLVLFTFLADKRYSAK